ncbi:DNA cytosine methyltransferase, partial [bacterium LRH843]|nr:DNA cytosine methyltransferase [bacterium LRH843]
CPSIFTRTRPLAPATLERIAGGLKKFVFDNPEPFIVENCTPFLAGAGGPKYSAKPTAINKPMGTLCASGNYKGIIAP